MLKLGKLTDYAVALTTQLARLSQQGGEAAAQSASQLAELTGLPEPTVAKIMKKLSQEKIVVSARGAAGGYRLSVPAVDMTIRRVIEAMDGPVAITACVDETDTSCATGHACPARGKWRPVNDAIRAALDAVTLADMAAQPALCPPAPVNVAMPVSVSVAAEVTHARLD